MPELPEVETVRRTLINLVKGRTIEQVQVSLARIIWQPNDVQRFESQLCGQTIVDIRRYGKYLCFDLDHDVLVSHLRMEGKYGVYANSEEVEKHTHVIFRFVDGMELRYRDVRQFGTMELVPRGYEFSLTALNKLGPEPLDPKFSEQAWFERIDQKKGKIKALLLNQSFVAGVGNIYADELLFRARIHPEKLVNDMNLDEKKRIFVSLRNVLQEAVDQGGSSVKSYVNGQGEMGYFQQQLDVYGRNGQLCKVCASEIVKFVSAGRGTHICPTCQSL